MHGGWKAEPYPTPARTPSQGMGAIGPPPAFHNRPSRGRRPRSSQPPDALLSCAACPGRTAPLYALLRGASGGLPRRAGGAGGLQGGRCRGAGAAMPCALPRRFLSARPRPARRFGGLQITIIHHDRGAFRSQFLEVFGALPSLGPIARCGRPGPHGQPLRHPLGPLPGDPFQKLADLNSKVP